MMQPATRSLYPLLALVFVFGACNKSDNTPPPVVNHPPGIPAAPPAPPPSTTCTLLPAGAVPGWTSTGFWLDGMLQFEPQQVEVKDTAGYWLITAQAAANQVVYLSFTHRPAKSRMYYRAHAFPTKQGDDSCAMHVAYSNGQSGMVSHALYSPDNWDSDKVPVYVSNDSIYVSFEYSAGASTGGAPYKIAGKVKGKRTW